MKLKNISAPKKVFTLMGLIILIFIIAVGLYITSPSASVSSMKDEVSKYLIDGSRVEEESYNTGSCFDVCSSGDAVIEIPETTDFEELFDKYYALIKDNQCEHKKTKKKVFKRLKSRLLNLLRFCRGIKTFIWIIINRYRL